jgi:fucokinase
MPLLNRTLEKGALELLQQGYRNNWQQYLAALDGQGVRLPAWDWCILTASSARQAEAYEAQIKARRRSGLLPRDTRFLVFADPQDLRIGSGGATLNALLRLAQQLSGVPGAQGACASDLLAGKRILIIHSGGESRRLPHCSAVGKLFARVPHQLPDGRASSLFDEFLVSLSGLPGQIPQGVLVASGDVLLLFDHLQLRFDRPGIAGVAAAAPAQAGTQHGVYVTAPGSRRVQAFLHKPSLERLQAHGAVLADGNVQIDTGLVWFGRQALEHVFPLAEQLKPPIARGVTINLYGDLIAPLAEDAALDDYLADASDGTPTPPLVEARRTIWQSLRGLPMTCEKLEPAAFIHFGTTQEYLELLQQGARVFEPCGWTRHAASWVPPLAARTLDQGTVLVNSYAEQISASRVCLLDSALDAHLLSAPDCLIADLVTHRAELQLAPATALHQLTLRDGQGFVTRLYGVRDDPKQSLADGGTFLNIPWATWLQTSQVDPEELWASITAPSERTLWNAALFPVCQDREECLDLALWLQAPQVASAAVRQPWQAARRLSLAESYAQADVHKTVNEAQAIEDKVRARRFCAGLERETAASELAPLLGSLQEARRRAPLVADLLELSIDPWLPIRGYRALAVATEDPRWDQRAFSALARLVRAHTVPAPRQGAPVDAQGSVTIQAAARLDFGGGWTDTPPHSLERGGRVLNAAITLWGKHPIVAQAAVLPEPDLVLECQDIEAIIRPRCLGEVLDYANPADPFALHKAALVYSGLIPSDGAPESEIGPLLRRTGYGFHLSTSTSIPRGSGLGTSSILAGAVLQALATLRGQPMDSAQLFDAVLCLEQMITTGGGWQDQIGGLVGGLKWITTQAGLPQIAAVEQVRLSAALAQALRERLLVIYTGQRRLAKDLLRMVMGRYMARDPEMLAMLRDIGELAQGMRGALQSEDLNEFGRLISLHWEINKRMDPGCSNPFIDRLVDLCRPYASGAKLAGAGGGGFMLLITQDREASQALKQTLLQAFPGQNVAIWPSAIAETGMLCETINGARIVWP